MINKVETFDSLEIGTKIIRYYTNNRPDILGVIALDNKGIKVMHHLSNRYDVMLKQFNDIQASPIINPGTQRPVKHYFNPQRYFYLIIDSNQDPSTQVIL